MSDLSMMHAAMRFARSQHPQLRISQLELLLAVRLKPGQTQTELAAECDLTLSAVSRAIDVLGEKGRKDKLSKAVMGWVETRRSTSDERILQVYLTKKGQNFVTMLEAICYGSPLLQSTPKMASSAQN